MSTKLVDGRLSDPYVLLMITPEQSRAARGWLNWTQAELAKRANVGLSTVKDFEGGKRVPIRNNLDAMRLALEMMGVAFVSQNDVAVGITVHPR